ncbi:uncharacterized protein LOC127790014 isoform X2 [Diospyros lotus]|uniref:uncharacterized protein LOC127790014 isoform X2 n=1 Tax=Diospyros lotus TaxID=55363 RepID=UPI002256AC97|nr:uncharacterized protein LOC127790014 isoform X2 [Diospyros lotus]XP_052175175.1 uncharacterized protein LOC127790014 isoform X2 [Diospyros lotus]
MFTDSITNTSIPTAASNTKYLAKKKRANRSAKLKQCKLDARREQWLSQVKNKESKEEADVHGGLCASSGHAYSEREQLVENLETKPRVERNGGLAHHYSDLDSPSNSPSSHASSILGGNVSGTNFSGSSGGSGSGSSSSGGSCSGSITGEDEEGCDDCLDDWEAVADALAATDDKREQHTHSLEPLTEHESSILLDSPPELTHQATLGNEMSNPKPEHAEMVQKARPNCRAWTAGDAFRPQCLPNLSKQLSFPMNSGRQRGYGGGAWGCKNSIATPLPCPICCEDLDFTDSNFLPCSCGFRLCLFCHKRILEEDGRCPGCRKKYDHEPVKGETTMDGGNLTFQLARSFSMITRS